MTIDFSIRDFQNCHMKMPRGFGSWAFQYKNEEPFFVMGKYSEAKKEAAKRIKESHPELTWACIKVLG